MDDINKTEAGNEETGRRENNSWIKRNFNYECYMTFLNGCYSCKWEAQQKKKPRRPLCCCSLREQLFYPWLIMSFFLSIILLFTWVETSNEYNGFDWVVFLGTRIWFFWSLVLLSVLGILAAYTTMLVVIGFLLCWEKNELYLHWYHKILVLIVIMLCSLLMWILLTFCRERWLTIGLSLKVFAPYIHLSSISAMVLLSWPVAFYLIHLEGEARMRRNQNTSSERRRNKWCNMLTKLRVLQVVVGLPFLLILLCLYVVPFGTYSPCVQEKDKLAPKPTFFGHRGAAMVGPRMMDVGDLDEVPFLMHDYDLRRTTNILEVMPNASDKHSSFFYWNFLSTLNAGKWFADSRPAFSRKLKQNLHFIGYHMSRGNLHEFEVKSYVRVNLSTSNVFYSFIFSLFLFSLLACCMFTGGQYDDAHNFKNLNLCFAFLKIIKHNMLKILLFYSMEDGRRRGRQRMRWLDGVTSSMDMKLQFSTLLRAMHTFIFSLEQLLSIFLVRQISC
ncbi:hypothetical protein FD754_015772 [Muntiacus muntjak]|uniref:Uncharacterized protein n=1 Tax=Muntiacus muntjak TaxID=9888 RepID=A0A5N3VR85_MUNMU|nr:hypothetical protein FD754_015772 [Muntiacus muntjak]